MDEAVGGVEGMHRRATDREPVASFEELVHRNPHSREALPEPYVEVVFDAMPHDRHRRLVSVEPPMTTAGDGRARGGEARKCPMQVVRVEEDVDVRRESIGGAGMVEVTGCASLEHSHPVDSNSVEIRDEQSSSGMGAQRLGNSRTMHRLEPLLPLAVDPADEAGAQRASELCDHSVGVRVRKQEFR